MQMHKILLYIILGNILLIGIALPISAQEKKDTTKTKNPLYQGFTLEMDIVPLTEKVFSEGESYGVQGNLQFNLQKKYFPVIEIGFGGADKTLQNNTSFSGKGMYEKIGIDFNVMKQKSGSKIYNNYVLAGLRVAASQVNYHINNLYIEDNYWGGENNENIQSLTQNKMWIELILGMRVEVYKHIIMGWNVRNKHLLGSISNGKTYPYYIPGYGKTTTSLWGFSYIIGYRF